MKINKCKLCGLEKKTQKHHLIPKSVVKKINPKSELLNNIVYICSDCHNEVHYSFFQHMINNHVHNGKISKYSSIKYMVISSWLIKHYPKIMKEYKEFFKKFLFDSLDNFINGGGLNE